MSSCVQLTCQWPRLPLGFFFWSWFCFTNSVGVVVVEYIISITIMIFTTQETKNGTEWQFDGLFWIALLWWWYGYDYFMHQFQESAAQEWQRYKCNCDWLSDGHTELDGHPISGHSIQTKASTTAAPAGGGHLPEHYHLPSSSSSSSSGVVDQRVDDRAEVVGYICHILIN